MSTFKLEAVPSCLPAPRLRLLAPRLSLEFSLHRAAPARPAALAIGTDSFPHGALGGLGLPLLSCSLTRDSAEDRGCSAVEWSLWHCLLRASRWSRHGRPVRQTFLLPHQIKGAGAGTHKDVSSDALGNFPWNMELNLSILIIINYYLLHAHQWPWHALGLMFQ